MSLAATRGSAHRGKGVKATKIQQPVLQLSREVKLIVAISRVLRVGAFTSHHCSPSTCTQIVEEIHNSQPMDVSLHGNHVELIDPLLEHSLELQLVSYWKSKEWLKMVEYQYFTLSHIA